MNEVINKLITMVDETIQTILQKKDEKNKYIDNIKSMGDDVLKDVEIVKQIGRAEITLMDYEGELVELYDYRQSLIELQSHCDTRPKNNETFSGLIAQFGPQPEKYRVFNELLGVGWSKKMNKIPDNRVWQQLDLILGGANNE